DDLSHLRYIDRWVALYDEDIREQPGLYPPYVLGNPKDIGIHGRGRSQYVERFHRVIDHHLRLARIVPMRKNADVATHADRDAGRQRFAKPGPFFPDAPGLGVDPFSPPGILQYSVPGRQSRA